MSRDQFSAARDKLLDLANADPKLTGVRHQRPARRRRRSRSTSIQQKLTRDGPQPERREQHALDRLGRALRQRLHRQGPRQARLRPGRRALPRRPAEPRPMVRPLVDRRDGAVLRPSRKPAGRRLRAACSRFQGVPSFEFQGQPAPGVSSGEAMDEMQKLADQIPGTSVAWAGQSYQERLSSGQAPLLYAMSLLVVFLCLAALYESWSIPVAVLLVIPLGLVGAVFAVTLRGLAERRLPADRPAHDDGPRRQERDPDDRVRRAGGEEGRADHRRRARSGANPAAADPDDQLLLHLRRASAGDLDRRRARTAASPSARR